MKFNKFYLVRVLTKIGITRSIALFFVKLTSKETHLPNTETIFKNIDIKNINLELKKKGYALGIKLPKTSLDDILEFCKTNETIIDFDNSRKILIPMDKETNPSDGTVYKYTNTYKNCDTVKKIAHDPTVVAIAREYLGTHPKFIGSQMWWSYPKLDSNGNEIKTSLYGFHYDIDDLKFIKLFFYLNDVDESRGPHVIIGNTHKSKSLYEKKNRRLTDEDAQQRYKDQIHIIKGEAGVGFFEDTFCYHKGTHPHKRRLLLQFEYAVNNFDNHDTN